MAFKTNWYGYKRKIHGKAGLPLEDDDKSKLGLALGGTTTTFSLQLAQGYTTFANKGVMTKPYAIRKIEMRDGEVKKPDIQTEQVMSEENADTMTSMLQDVIEKAMEQVLTLVLHEMLQVKPVQPMMSKMLGLSGIPMMQSFLSTLALIMLILRKQRNTYQAAVDKTLLHCLAQL
ncbi:penicillin-binding transpeptidase domain-containing protein [Priestia megaterium]